MIALRPHAPRLLFWLACLVSFFFNLGGFPLFDLDEGAYAETTREMFVRGDFITTYMNGEPFYDKPIMMYWLQSLSIALFGISEWSFRLPSALGSVAWVVTVAWFISRLRGREQGYLAGSVVALALLVAFIGKAAIPDGVLNFLLTLSMALIYLYFRERHTVFLYVAFAVIALGVLTKGPIALLVPVASTFLFCLLTRQLKFWLRSVFNPLGIVIFFAIATPWYVANYLREGQAFIDGFFFKHNVGRFSAAMEGHGGSIFYYVPVVLLGVMPFTAATLLALRKIRDVRSDDLLLFLLCWFGFVFIFFSLSGTKLPHYINYGLTGLLMVSALYVDRLRSPFLALLPVMLFMALLLFMPELIGQAVQDVRNPYFHASLQNYQDYFPLGYRVWMATSLLLCIALVFAGQYSLRSRLLASGFVTVIAVSGFVMPAIGAMLQQPVKEAAQLARTLDASQRIVSYRINMPSFSVYSERLAPRIMDVQGGDVVFTTPAYVQELGVTEELYRKNGIALVRVISR